MLVLKIPLTKTGFWCFEPYSWKDHSVLLASMFILNNTWSCFSLFLPPLHVCVCDCCLIWWNHVINVGVNICCAQISGQWDLDYSEIILNINRMYEEISPTVLRNKSSKNTKQYGFSVWCEAKPLGVMFPLSRCFQVEEMKLSDPVNVHL